MLESLLQGANAGLHVISLILVLFAALYAVYALFGRPHDALAPLLEGVPIAALIGVFTYAFDVNQHGVYSRTLAGITGQPATSYTLLLVGAAMGLAQPFLYERAYSRMQGRGRLKSSDRLSDAGEAVRMLVRVVVGAFWITLGLLVALDKVDLLHGTHISLAQSILAGAAVSFLSRLSQIARIARQRSGARPGAGTRTLTGLLSVLAGLVAFVAGLALFIYVASHVGWSVVIYLLLFGLITSAYAGVQFGITRLPRGALGGLAALLLVMAGVLQLLARG